jgi:hypothetical protein
MLSLNGLHVAVSEKVTTAVRTRDPTGRELVASMRQVVVLLTCLMIRAAPVVQWLALIDRGCVRTLAIKERINFKPFTLNFSSELRLDVGFTPRSQDNSGIFSAGDAVGPTPGLYRTENLPPLTGIEPQFRSPQTSH